MSEKEEIKYVDLNISPEMLTLFYLSQITKIDLMTLTLLFEKIGTSLHYIFYILSKKKISFPSEANLLKAISFSDTVEMLDNNHPNCSKIPERDKEIFNNLVANIVDKKYIRVYIDPVEETPIIKVARSTKNHNPQSELNSSIKKYIRKEKRRLERIGQLKELFEIESSIRKNLIDKIFISFENKAKEVENLRQFIGNLIDSYNKYSG